MESVSTLLSAFKMKIEESVTLVPSMTAEEKLKAVQFWNVVSEKLQEIVNNSAADISALAFEMEKHQDSGKKVSESDVLQHDQDHCDSMVVHDPASMQETQTMEALTSNESGGCVDQPRLSYQLDLMPGPVAVTESSGVSSVDHSGSVESLMNATSAPDSGQSMSYVSSSVVHSIGGTDGHQSASLLMMPVNEEEESLNMIDVAPRSSRLQELLNRPIVASDNLIEVPNTATSKKGFSVIRNSTRKTRIKTATARKRVSSKKVRKGKNFVPSSADEENFAETSCAMLGEQNVVDDQSILTDIKIETVEGPVVTNQSHQYEENTLSTVVVAVKDLKAVGSDGNDDVEIEDDENDEEEEEEEDGLDETIDIDPVVDSNGKKVYTCGYCQKTYANASAYKAHKYSHTKPYGCTECHARFTTRGNLIVHTRRHTGEKPYGCPQCKAKFSTKGNLKRHIRSHSGARPWECLQCGGRFTEKKSLTVHMRRHTGERPYQCTICGKQFAQTGILQTHMSMHMDQREHLCEHCGKSFRQKSQLRLHMMRHQGVRKYNCDQCDSKFLTKGDLERHHRTHTGERPFVCEMCGKTFTRQQSLNEHMNRHYGLRPYECKYCGKRFAEMSACYKHIKHHERLAKKNGTQLPTLATTKRASMTTADGTSPESPTSSSQQFTLDEVDDDSTSEKFPVLLHAEVALDVVQREVGADDEREAMMVGGADSDFTDIKLLANASTLSKQFDLVSMAD